MRYIGSILYQKIILTLWFYCCTMHKYYAFGIHIDSEIELPYFPIEKEGETDVAIRYGYVPEKVKDPLYKGLIFESGVNEFIMDIPDIAKFYITGGKEIIVSPVKGTGEDAVRSLLIGSVFSALFQQRGLLPIHGSCVQDNNRNIILAGTSGSGKSTLAACFYQKGHPVLSDDLCIIDKVKNGKVFLYPGYGAIKLWEDVTRKMNIRGDLRQVRKDLKKYFYRVDMPKYEKPQYISSVYILFSSHQKGNEIHRINGMNKFLTLKNNTYGVPFIKKTAYEAAHFRMCTAMAQQVDVFTLRRHRGDFNPSGLYEMIRKEYEKH